MFCDFPKYKHLKQTIYRGPGGTGEARTDSDITEVRIIADEAEGYKDQAAASASAAASSASAAATAETNAETAEANAETAEANAEAAQAAAEAAQAAAEAAQTAAEAAQTAAELAETNAETAEANAETAEANAETAQAAAEAALASAQAVYDNFDDRYLGAKTSNPTVDNDGNALLTGALYFNTVAPEMRVYNGSAWQNFAAASAVSSFNSRTGAVTLSDTDVNTALGYTAANNSSVLLKANNLSDLTSASTARTNLGLGTAATTASTAYATAAQGTNADTAYGWGNHASAGYAADNAVVKLTGDQTVAGTKTFSSTITGSVSGNAGTVTNGVYTSSSYADPSWITSLAGSKVSGNIAGNAANVTGTVAVANGGTGATTASGARTNLDAQVTLVSGTNIKTINSTSLLGSGDLSVGVSDGDKGDITVSSSGATWTIDSSVVTTDKIADANVTAAKLSGGQSGSAPIYGARAWVNFNGTGTVAIRASGNVTSITDNGTGDYTVNFTTAMPDANYSVSVTGSGNSTGAANNRIIGSQDGGGTSTASAVRVGTNTTTAAYDALYTNVSVFR